MKHFIGKLVEYTGQTNPKLHIKTGETYPVSHIYGSNVTLNLGNGKFSSIDHRKLKIVGILKGNDELKVYSVLMLGKKPVGVRLVKGFEFYDVELESIRGVTKTALKDLDEEMLVEHGELLVTGMELNSDVKVIDKSDDVYFCNQVVSLIMN